jgi:hypothetical protein
LRYYIITVYISYVYISTKKNELNLKRKRTYKK